MLLFLLSVLGIFASIIQNKATRNYSMLLIAIALFFCTFATFHELDISIKINKSLSLSLKYDKLGEVFLHLVSFLWCVTCAYSIKYAEINKLQHQKTFFACFWIAITCVIGIALSGNLFTLFLFYEFLTFSTYPLVVHKRNQTAFRGGNVYIKYLSFSSLMFLLPAIIFCAQHGWDLHSSHHMQSNTQTLILFLLFLYGFGKIALMPMHRWLPSAMVAPSPVSAFLHAVAVVKGGIFALIKVSIYLFGISTLKQLPNALTYISGFTIIASSLIAMKHDNIKSRLAYSTISQLAYITIILSSFNEYSIAIAMYYLYVHAFSKITLFLATGAIHSMSHRDNVHKINGMIRRMPITTICFSVAALSMLGMPFTGGFWGKFFILYNAFTEQQYFVLIVMIISTLLNAYYFLSMLYNMIFKLPDQNLICSEAPISLLIPIVITTSIVIAMFFITVNMNSIFLIFRKYMI